MTLSASIKRTTVAALALTALLLPRHEAQAYTYKVLHDFCSISGCRDGNAPQAGLIMDAAGNLYGTAQFGGTQGNGTLFRMKFDAAKSKWNYHVLHHFCSTFQGGCADGSQPSSSLIFDASGNLYGTTFRGGAGDGSGIVFKLTDPNGGTRPPLEALHVFCPGGDCAPGEDGVNPVAGLSYAGSDSGAAYDGVSPLTARRSWPFRAWAPSTS